MTTMFFIRNNKLYFGKKLVFSGSSPDGNEKPGMDTTNFSCSKKATKRSSFLELGKTVLYMRTCSVQRD